MKKALSIWQFAGFVFTTMTGTLLHFLYDWTNQSLIVAPFSAVNESIWEHMKLLFFPMFAFAFVQSHYFSKEYENFWCAKLVGIALALTTIPVLYYTYTGILGTSADWFNIIIFFLAASAAYILETRLLKQEKSFCFSPTIAQIILFLFALAFIILTFTPLQIPIFQDPVTNLYGLE